MFGDFYVLYNISIFFLRLNKKNTHKKNKLNFVPNFIAIGWTLRPTAQPQNCDTYIFIIYSYIYKPLNGGCFGSLGAMIRETMMTFSGSSTMRVSAIGIFLRNLLKNTLLKSTKYVNVILNQKAWGTLSKLIKSTCFCAPHFLIKYYIILYFLEACFLVFFFKYI